MLKIYGCSDDLIEVEGYINEEYGCYGTDKEDRKGVLIVASDGTVAEIKYGKLGQGIWGIQLLAQGSCFVELDLCVDESAKPYSDILLLDDDVKWVVLTGGQWQFAAKP